MIGMGGAQISIEVYGYDIKKSTAYVNDIIKAIEPVPGLKDLSVSREEGLPEKVVAVNREKASRMGLSAAYIAGFIRDNVGGDTATRYRKEGREYDVIVRLAEQDRKEVRDIKRIQVNLPSGKKMPLGNVVDIQTASGPAAIERKKQERVVYINCKAEGRDLNSVVNDIQAKIEKLVKPRNFQVEIAGAYKDMEESFRDLALALILAVILIYIIMASQFESFSSPFIIMFSIPTVFFGVSLFLFLTGTTFNVISFMGVLVLSGIVVNNAIVYIDYSNILQARGLSLHDALIEAGKKRLRPILMTTFTTITALVPMALGLGDGSELSAPLARSVIGGMSSSFLFTLIFVPVVSSLFDSAGKRFKAWRGTHK